MRQVEYYNLDAIISVGYRVNSTQATRSQESLSGRLLIDYFLLKQQLLMAAHSLTKLIGPLNSFPDNFLQCEAS